MSGGQRSGPLAGLTVIEMAGLGPVPLAGLMLADLGARVLRIERKGAGRAFLPVPDAIDPGRHGRETLSLDLKSADGAALLLDLVAGADILVEGFRPGVMERLGLGPQTCMARNERLVYGRMTGFGQDGPLAPRAGHDITYLAYTGALHAIGERGGRPIPPLNLVADYGGGTMFLMMGLLAAVVERASSGKGQVVDAAMIDGVSMLATPVFALMAAGLWQDRRGVNLLDTGAPFYDTYETRDGGHVAVGCLEPPFFAEFARLLPLDPRFVDAQYEPACWPDMRQAIAARLMQKTRDAWAELFEPTDACVAPVLSFIEAKDHPHNRARAIHTDAGGLERPAPAPRFSRTPGQASGPQMTHVAEILGRFGIARKRIEALASAGIVGR